MSGKPERPSEDDCCGSGCTPCIFDVYEKKLASWRENLLEEVSDKVLCDLKYSNFQIINIENVTNETIKYTLQAIDVDFKPIMAPINFKMGDHIILKASVDDLNISRPYTPLFNDCLFSGKIELIIKLYVGGKMSEVLRKSNLFDVLSCRGPYNDLKYIANKYLFLVGAGTGVVPLHNIAKTIVLNDSDETIIYLLACFPTVADIVLRNEIRYLCDYWNFHCKFFFSNCESTPLMHGEAAVFDKLDASLLTKELAVGSPDDRTVIICGPQGFNDMCLHASQNLKNKDNVTIL